MNRASRPQQNRQIIKLTVRALLSGRVFRCFLACLIPAALPWVLQLFNIPFGAIHVVVSDLLVYRISLPMAVLSFLTATFVTDPMTVRVAGYFIHLNEDAENLPSPLTVCDCFGPGYLRLVAGMLERYLRIFIPAAIPILIGILIPGAWTRVVVGGIEAFRIADWAYLLVFVALGIMIQRTLVYAMVPYLLYDDPTLSAREAVRKSRAMTRGRLWELFILQLSFFGWLLLTSMTLMIGAIYTYPYVEGTMAAYYLAFREPMPWELKANDAP